MKTILIDGDILNYKIGFSVETPTYVVAGKVYNRRGMAVRAARLKGLDVVNDVHKRKNIGPFQLVQDKLRAQMNMIFDDNGTKQYKLFLTSSDLQANFRASIATIMPYKGNRKDMERPRHYKRLRELLISKYGAIMVEGQEADDTIVTAQYEAYRQKGHFDSTVIATIDKDLRMAAGEHYNLNTRQIDFIDEEEALKNFYGQLLTGDPTDNIPGLTRLLKVRGRKEEANAISYGRPGYISQWNEYRVDHSSAECRRYVIDKYISYGFGKEEIEEIGRLLWMRRSENEMWTLH